MLFSPSHTHATHTHRPAAIMQSELLGAEAARSSTRYLLAVCVTWNLFANHWSRDSLGALEIPLEHGNQTGLSVRQYNSLQAAYFTPNLPVPILAGVLSQMFGPANVMVGFTCAAFFGNTFVAMAAGPSGAQYHLLLLGRSLMGIAYEALDILPIGLMQPRFVASWARLVGVINGVNRLGSVCNFLIEPLLLAAGGLHLALLVPSLLGCSMLLSSATIHRLDAALRRRERARAAVSSSSPAFADGEAGRKGAPTPPTLSLRSLRDFSATYWLYLLGAACA